MVDRHMDTPCFPDAFATAISPSACAIRIIAMGAIMTGMLRMP